eukprot:5749254-Pleurochrysis_carterae.AAC.6
MQRMPLMHKGSPRGAVADMKVSAAHDVAANRKETQRTAECCILLTGVRARYTGSCMHSWQHVYQCSSLAG